MFDCSSVCQNLHVLTFVEIRTSRGCNVPVNWYFCFVSGHLKSNNRTTDASQLYTAWIVTYDVLFCLL